MNLYREAEVFGRYIIGQDIGAEEKIRYEAGVLKLKYDLEDGIVNLAVKRPFLLPYIDASQSFMDKKHILQKKLILMFSILETTPKYASFFMAKPRSLLYLFVVIFIGIKGIFKTFVGIILYKLLAKKIF